ncbi:MAG: SCO family protein [Marinicaulis sp.]|nr:SCO family protein [Marinicaulis sp.]NNL88660.1 SCO family protein [Marinicaulis sp.]
MRNVKLVLGAIAAAALFASCERETSSSNLIPIDGVIRLSDQFTGNFALTDKNGAAVDDEDFEGKVMLVYFGFTHCPDVCPGDVGVMSATLNALGDDAGEVAPIFISVDPARDTPQALSDYFAFDERITALTGDEDAAKAARDGFKVYANIEPLPDSALEYTVNHQRMFFVTDRAGQPQIAITGGIGPDELTQLLRRQIEA